MSAGITWLGLLAIPFAHHAALHLGFLAFSLGIPLSLLAFAIWIRISTYAFLSRFLIMQVVVITLYLCHFYAFAITAVLVGGWTFASNFNRLDNNSLLGRLVDASLTSLKDALPFILPFLFLLTLPDGEGLIEPTRYYPLVKIANLPGVVSPFPTVVGLSISVLALIILAFSVFLHPPSSSLRFPLILLAAMYPVLPSVLLTSAFADWRVLLSTYFVLIGVIPGHLIGNWLKRSIAVVSFLGVAFVAINYMTFAPTRATLTAELDRIMEPVAPGSRLVVLATTTSAARYHNYWRTLHYPSELVWRKSVYLPSTFAYAKQQPLLLAPEYEALKRAYALTSYTGPKRWALLSGVEERFDYLMWLRSPDESPRRWPLAVGEIVMESPYATLYRLSSDD